MDPARTNSGHAIQRALVHDGLAAGVEVAGEEVKPVLPGGQKDLFPCRLALAGRGDRRHQQILPEQVLLLEGVGRLLVGVFQIGAADQRQPGVMRHAGAGVDVGKQRVTQPDELAVVLDALEPHIPTAIASPQKPWNQSSGLNAPNCTQRW